MLPPATTVSHDPTRRTVTFERGGSNAFRGEFYLRDYEFDDFKLTSSVGRIPQDACEAVKAAISQLENGVWPQSYEDALIELASISDVHIWDPA